jgi:hypothetical protein
MSLHRGWWQWEWLLAILKGCNLGQRLLFHKNGILLLVSESEGTQNDILKEKGQTSSSEGCSRREDRSQTISSLDQWAVAVCHFGVQYWYFLSSYYKCILVVMPITWINTSRMLPGTCWEILVESITILYKVASSSDHPNRKTKLTDQSNDAESCKWCHICTANHKCTTTKFQCTKCKVGLYMKLCFRIYHSEENFWIMNLSYCREETT